MSLMVLAPLVVVVVVIGTVSWYADARNLGRGG